MQFEEMGNMQGKTLMLLPGTGCVWQTNFKNVMGELGKHFHLICVNYDGFDGNQSVIFPSMIQVTEKIKETSFSAQMKKSTLKSRLLGTIIGNLSNRLAVYRWRE